MMDTLLLLALNGLIWGLIIALIALGLSIIFGLLDVINIAHGDFFMVGTVLAWFTLELTGSFWAAFLIVPLIGFILGALTQRVIIQPIRNVAALTIVATFGLSLILQEGVRITFGTTPRRILPPIQGRIADKKSFLRLYAVKSENPVQRVRVGFGERGFCRCHDKAEIIIKAELLKKSIHRR